MSILIKGMEMPMGGHILIVFPSGRVLEVSADATQDIFKETQAVSIPPHGDLVDMNAKINVYDRYDDDIIHLTTVRGLINEYISGGYPRTIIPAEEDE